MSLVQLNKISLGVREKLLSFPVKSMQTDRWTKVKQYDNADFYESKKRSFFGKQLTLSQTTNFTNFQIQRVFRRQF